MMKFHQTRVAILQIASESDFFIFDLIKLNGNLNFEELIQELFMSMEILKIGLYYKTDFTNLCRSYPEMKCFTVMFNFIELSEVYKDLFPSETKTSLQSIVEKVLS
jgi:hypothetical protein